MRFPIRLGAALLLLGLAACGDLVARPTPTPTPTSVPSTTPVARPSDTPTQAGPAEVDAAGAAAIVRARVTALDVRLLPSAVPAGMVAAVSASPTGFFVQYTDDTHAHTILVASDGPVGVNGPHQVVRQVPFRGATAEYFIFDTTVPTSQRRLYWREPGTGNVYLFMAIGFSETEFFQLAGSLRAV